MTKNKIATLGISLLAGLLITGGVVGATALSGPSTAYAAPQVTESPAFTQATVPLETTDDTKNDVAEQENNGSDTATEAKEDAGLTAKAVVSATQANDAVTAAYPGCTIVSTKLGDENGTVVYEVAITDKSGKALEVKIDASSAKVLSSDSGIEDNTESDSQENAGQEADTDNVEQEGEH